MFPNTDARKFTEKYTKIYKEMAFKDCKAERDCKFLVKISSRLYKIVKSFGPLVSRDVSPEYSRFTSISTAFLNW